jgi:SAM-dependent methyltransferase
MSTDLYTDDVGATMYDIAFDWRRNKEADLAEACLNAFGIGSVNAVLDVACGGGHFLLEMQARGWRVAGIDASPQMISRARERLGCSASLLDVACMSRFTIADAFGLVTCWYDSLPYLVSNTDIIRHLERVCGALTDGGLYLVDLGFGRWSDSMWQQGHSEWRADFSNGWSMSRGQVEVYHDGCDGPPCDGMSHTYTEYMYFRATNRTSGQVSEHTYTARKRALHPQEFAALVTAAGGLEIAKWLTGNYDLDKTLESADGRGRGVVVLRKQPGQDRKQAE